MAAQVICHYFTSIISHSRYAVRHCLTWSHLEFPYPICIQQEFRVKVRVSYPNPNPKLNISWATSMSTLFRPVVLVIALVQALVAASPLSPSPVPRYFQKHPLSRRELSVNDIQLELGPILSNGSTRFGPSDPNFSHATERFNVLAPPSNEVVVVPALATAFAPEANAETMREAIVHLILLPLDQVDEGKPLHDFGVDSTIASEFCSWFWTVFSVDVPFLDIMNPQKSLLVLVEFVEGKVLQGVTK